MGGPQPTSANPPPAAASSPIQPQSVLAVIPARWGSSRFPGKPLALLGDRPMIAHVVAAARGARRVGSVLVATDDERIAAAARAAGASVALTRADHATGTDRIGEAVAGRTEAIVLNIQGDEPLVPPAAIDRLVELLERDPRASASTLACVMSGEPARFADPNVVKVVVDSTGRALYFSRAPIPGRHPAASGAAAPPLRHVGLYGFRREALLRFLARPPTPLERAEGLEQLRLLEAGEAIIVGVVDDIPPGVDTPDGLRACAEALARQAPGGGRGGASRGGDVG